MKRCFIISVDIKSNSRKCGNSLKGGTIEGKEIIKFVKIHHQESVSLGLGLVSGIPFMWLRKSFAFLRINKSTSYSRNSVSARNYYCIYFTSCFSAFLFPCENNSTASLSFISTVTSHKGHTQFTRHLCTCELDVWQGATCDTQVRVRQWRSAAAIASNG